MGGMDWEIGTSCYKLFLAWVQSLIPRHVGTKIPRAKGHRLDHLKKKEEENLGNSPEVQWSRLGSVTAQVQSLVGERRPP